MRGRGVHVVRERAFVGRADLRPAKHASRQTGRPAGRQHKAARVPMPSGRLCHSHAHAHAHALMSLSIKKKTTSSARVAPRLSFFFFSLHLVPMALGRPAAFLFCFRPVYKQIAVTRHPQPERSGGELRAVSNAYYTTARREHEHRHEQEQRQEQPMRASGRWLGCGPAAPSGARLSHANTGPWWRVGVAARRRTARSARSVTLSRPLGPLSPSRGRSALAAGSAPDDALRKILASRNCGWPAAW